MEYTKLISHFLLSIFNKVKNGFFFEEESRLLALVDIRLFPLNEYKLKILVICFGFDDRFFLMLDFVNIISLFENFLSKNGYIWTFGQIRLKLFLRSRSLILGELVFIIFVSI